MEVPDFLPEGEGEWLDGLLSDFGEPAPIADIGFDLNNLTSEEVMRASIANTYVGTIYTDPYIQMPEDLGAAALSMMRTLARFVEFGSIHLGDTFVRIGDRFPDLSVTHVNLSASIGLRESERDILSSIEGTQAYNYNLVKKSYCAVLKAISGKAMEFEEKRKGKSA